MPNADRVARPEEPLPEDAPVPIVDGPDEPPESGDTRGLSIAPSLLFAAASPVVEAPSETTSASAAYAQSAGLRGLFVTSLACGVAFVAGIIAQMLVAAIALVTNLAFYGTFSFHHTSPAHHHLGIFVIAVPVLGALVVGMIARFGSAAVRGHGIPEAMEQVLFNESRIPARVLFLKPLSAIISIGTGGPFGAEGPIIATGGALGSLVGQYVRVSPEERKTLLAAGAAAGMSATFGSPVASVLLAIELLLFEYRARSLVPVALACVTAASVRMAWSGDTPAFAVGTLTPPTAVAIFGYVLLGAIVGLASVVVTKAVYAVEDGFEKLPIHWMWWPALGALIVGSVGVVAPRTMGVGYDNIEQMVSGDLAGSALFVLCGWKLVSWLFSLGSGTSGGTLAPLFTVGGGAGAAIATAFAALVPNAGIDPRLGALVGMAAMFSGASRAVLTSAVFAFETTRQSAALLPLLGGCFAAYWVSSSWMKNSIMTEKIARRGRPVPEAYTSDYLEQVLVGDVALREVVTLSAQTTVADARAVLATVDQTSAHHAFPVVDHAGVVVGVITRGQLFEQPDDRPVAELIARPPLTIDPSKSLRAAADTMVLAGVGRLPVVRESDHVLVGIVTRSDLLEAHQRRLAGEHKQARRSFVGRHAARPDS